jgi:hypothetical protein
METKEIQKTFTQEELYWACLKCVELYEMENRIPDSRRLKKPSAVVENWLENAYNLVEPWIVKK